MSTYASEYNEDIFIDGLNVLPPTGFYLDLGCAWPHRFSNSEFLRQRGWSGLCIDANPVYADRWRGVAPFYCAVLGDGSNACYVPNEAAPELGRIADTGMMVQTEKLTDILAQFGIEQIDFISCDLEAHEFAALSTLDWDKFKPKVVVSEYSTWNPAPVGVTEDFRVKEMLEKVGYEERHRTVANIVYVLP